mgnify:CR=1 FL=1
MEIRTLPRRIIQIIPGDKEQSLYISKPRDVGALIYYRDRLHHHKTM